MKKFGNIVLECMSVLLAFTIFFVMVAGAQSLLGVASLIFGFTYNSIWSMLIFFAFCGFVCVPLERTALVVPRILLEHEKLSLTKARILFVMLDTIMSTITFLLVENVMSGVSATPASIILFSFVLALLSAKKEITPPLTREEREE